MKRKGKESRKRKTKEKKKKLLTGPQSSSACMHMQKVKKIKNSV